MDEVIIRTQGFVDVNYGVCIVQTKATRLVQAALQALTETSCCTSAVHNVNDKECVQITKAQEVVMEKTIDNSGCCC